MAKSLPMKWSASRANLLSACARRYAFQYVLGKGKDSELFDRSSMLVIDQGRWRPPRDLMVLTAKDVLRQRLIEAANGVLWSHDAMEATLERKLKLRIAEQYRQQEHLARRMGWDKIPQRRLSKAKLTDLVNDGMERLVAAEAHPLLCRILKGARDSEWLVPNSLQTVNVDGNKIYAAPDLIIREGRKWRLVRFSGDIFWRKPSALRQVELHAMLLWAQESEGLPNSPRKYKISRLGWNDGNWVLWSQHGSAKGRLGAKKLIANDVASMHQVARTMGPARDVDKLAYAQEMWRCRKCPYRWTCQGASNPIRSRLEQGAVEAANSRSQFAE
jgi:hypothetical protein